MVKYNGFEIHIKFELKPQQIACDKFAQTYLNFQIVLLWNKYGNSETFLVCNVMDMGNLDWQRCGRCVLLCITLSHAQNCRIMRLHCAV